MDNNWTEELENYEAEGGVYFACHCEHYISCSEPAHGNTIQRCQLANRIISNWTVKIPLFCPRRKNSEESEITKETRINLELEKVLLEICKNNKLWNRRIELLELIVEAFKKHKNTCHLCELEYDDYSIPSEWWNKLTENLRNKCLCFDCYMTKTKRRISVDVSNATTLTWDEKHCAVYLKPEDIIKVDIKPAKWRVKKREGSKCLK